MLIIFFRFKAPERKDTKNKLTASAMVVRDMDRPAVAGVILYFSEYRLISGWGLYIIAKVMVLPIKTPAEARFCDLLPGPIYCIKFTPFHLIDRVIIEYYNIIV
jgi:hypothetical protein